MEARSHPRSNTQTISLIVGFALFILGITGILFPTIAGLHLSTFHSSVTALAGGILFYSGFKDNDRDSFLACLFLGLFFTLHAIAGFAFGQSGIENNSAHPELLRIIPNFYELGTVDHVMNGIIGVVLLGGALDWWRVHHERRRWNRHDRRRERFNKTVHQH